jgi:hypothetical protein
MAPSFRQSAASLAVLASLLSAPSEAHAYCRSTTCTGDCPRDDDGCKTTGHKLFWPGLCVGFSLQKDGTAFLPMVQVRKVVTLSFLAWSERECDGGGTTTLQFTDLDDVACKKTEYNEELSNANVIMFQDNKWIYKGDENTLAKTTVTFDNETGEIFDADIEVNTASNTFTVSDQNVEYDLQSVMTHEAGHFIGLDHSPDFDATMNASYNEGDTSLRDLEPDDIAATCEVYPPNRAVTCDPQPRNGLGFQCADLQEELGGGEEGGCAVAPSPPRRDLGPAAFAALLALGVAAASRRSTRRSSCAGS